MSACARRIWRVRGAFSDSIVNEFRWETKKTHSYWSDSSVKITQFALMAGKEWKESSVHRKLFVFFVFLSRHVKWQLCSTVMNVLLLSLNLHLPQGFLCWIKERRGLIEIFLKTGTLSAFVCAYLRKIKKNTQNLNFINAAIVLP